MRSSRCRLDAFLEQHLPHGRHRKRDGKTLEFTDDPFVSPVLRSSSRTAAGTGRNRERWRARSGRPVDGEAAGQRRRDDVGDLRRGRLLSGGETAAWVIGSLTDVDLYWLPLGAGGRSVRLTGLVFEAVAARLGRRTACDLYRSALVVRASPGQLVIKQAPVRDSDGARRGVVAEGAVGSRLAGRFRIRYEVRRWRDGVIPNVAHAVASPQLLTDDLRHA
jgi:hypothetical protein